MKGLTVQIGERKISAALENGGISIIISNKESKTPGRFHTNLGGMDNDNLHIIYEWLSVDLDQDEPMIIKVEEIDEASVTPPALIRNYKDPKDPEFIESMNQSLLDSYYELKQELIDEGRLEG